MSLFRKTYKYLLQSTTKTWEKFLAECPTPHLVIFSLSDLLLQSVAKGKSGRHVLTSTLPSRKCVMCSIWKYSMFVLTHKNKDDQLELSRKRKNSRSSRDSEKQTDYAWRTWTVMCTVHTKCLLQRTLYFTQRKLLLLSSFWDMVYATTATELF